MSLEGFLVDAHHRDYKTDVKCTVSISADTNEELVDAVVQHGTKVHGYKDNAEFRAQILKDMKE